MPQDLNIYVTTAANAVENSYGTYCPGMNPPPPTEFITCLGDVYSVSWMEDRQASFEISYAGCLFCNPASIFTFVKSMSTELKYSNFQLAQTLPHSTRYAFIFCCC
jgi:hypothetical protein